MDKYWTTKTIIISVFLVFLIDANPVQNLYIDPVNGDDSNSGEEDQPFKTIQAAASAVTEEDDLQLYLFPGVYHGANNINIEFVGNTYVEFYTTETGPSNEYAIIDCGNDAESIAFSGNRSFIIDSSNGNLEIRNCYTAIKVSTQELDNDYLFTALVVYITNCSIGLDISSVATVSITNSTFSTTKSGSSLYITSIPDKIEIYNSNFYGNKSAIVIGYSNYTEIVECYSNSNIRMENPDNDLVESYNKISNSVIEYACDPEIAEYAIQLVTAGFVIENSIVSNNNCGGISFLDSMFNIKGCTFDGNSASFGGALLLDQSNGTISQSTNFTNNSGASDGGAISLLSSVVYIVDTTFTNNHADNGAAISCDSNSLLDYDTESVSFQSNVNNNSNAADVECVNKEYISSIPNDYYLESPGSNIGLYGVFWIIFTIVMAIIVLFVIGGAIVGYVYRHRNRKGYFPMDDL